MTATDLTAALILEHATKVAAPDEPDAGVLAFSALAMFADHGTPEELRVLADSLAACLPASVLLEALASHVSVEDDLSLATSRQLGQALGRAVNELPIR